MPGYQRKKCYGSVCAFGKTPCKPGCEGVFVSRRYVVLGDVVMDAWKIETTTTTAVMDTASCARGLRLERCSFWLASGEFRQVKPPYVAWKVLMVGGVGVAASSISASSSSSPSSSKTSSVSTSASSPSSSSSVSPSISLSPPSSWSTSPS